MAPKTDVMGALRRAELTAEEELRRIRRAAEALGPARSQRPHRTRRGSGLTTAEEVSRMLEREGRVTRLALVKGCHGRASSVDQAVVRLVRNGRAKRPERGVIELAS
jgi:hypothetical protein